jgi:bifunctional DNA-binding transcriptional regulator/antitoxin component of YhaV-PrlF toxin-antitoxin module
MVNTLSSLRVQLVTKTILVVLGKIALRGQNLNEWVGVANVGSTLAVVVVDDRGRLTIPKEFEVRGTRATVIPAGPFLIVVPIPPQPIEASSSWLESKLSRKELKALAEKAARKDAVGRAKKRKQI